MRQKNLMKLAILPRTMQTSESGYLVTVWNRNTNGDAYIKKLHDEPDGLFLISLNKKYKPIAIQESDSFKIFGRVVGKCDASDIPGFQ